MTKKREWRLAAFAAFLCAAAIFVSGAQAQGSGTPTGGTNCYVNGQWVFYPSGGCPASGGGGGNTNTTTHQDAMDYSHYVSAYNRAMKLYKQGIPADAARAISLCQSALNFIDEALQYEPGDGDAQTLRRQITACISSGNGTLAVQRGDIDQGISYYRQAESEYPESNNLWERNIAWAESMRQQAIAGAQAKADADRAAEKKVQVDALWDRGIELVKSGDYKGAEVIWRQVIALDPQNFAAYFSLGRALRKQERYTEAEAALRHAVQLNPKYSPTELELGYVLYFQQRFTEAEAAFRQAIQLDPKNSDAECALGILLRDQNRYAEAEDAFRKTLELSPGDADTQQALQFVIDMQAKARQQEQSNLRASSVLTGSAATVSGPVFWLTSDSQKVPIESGKPVFLNQHVITGEAGHLQVLLLDGTVFTMGQNSDMVLDDFVYDPASDQHTIMAKLTKGVFRWVTGKTARKDPASMKVILPVGTIGPRGTDFEATVLEDESGDVKLYSGQLEITETKTGRIFLMNAGETVTYGSDGIFSLPKKMQ